jgi:2-(1,2-epoxy-1,2-dihydrophenyl)acetyl-CoA isomerase
MVEFSQQDAIATIAFNRPEALNALSESLMKQATAALTQAATGGARAIVLTGVGRAFSAGGDLEGFAEVIARGHEVVPREIGRWMRESFHLLVEAIARSPIPVVAAVNGPCAGGAVGVALAADVVIAARSAYFLVPQVAQLGIVPDLGATWALPRNVGRARGLSAALLGERITGERAEAWGLIWKCVDDTTLMHEATAIAQRLAGAPAGVVHATRALIDAAPRTTLADQLEAERAAQIEFLGTEAFRKAVARFIAASGKAR